MNLVNLTPHAITLVDPDDAGGVTIPPSGQVARVAVTRELTRTVVVGDRTIAVYATTYGAVEGLPDPAPLCRACRAWGSVGDERFTVCGCTGYLVSALVGQRVTDRADVYGVDDLVRDEAGRIIGARALAVSR